MGRGNGDWLHPRNEGRGNGDWFHPRNEGSGSVGLCVGGGWGRCSDVGGGCRGGGGVGDCGEYVGELLEGGALGERCGRERSDVGGIEEGGDEILGGGGGEFEGGGCGHVDVGGEPR